MIGNARFVLLEIGKLHHRDIKSENFIINTINGELRSTLFDFAYSKVAKNEIDAVVSGSEHSMAPEQYQLDAKSIDTSRSTQKTDVYAMGVIGFELFSGQRDKVDDGMSYESNFSNFCIEYDMPASVIIKLGQFFKKMMAHSATDRLTSRDACTYLKNEILELLAPKSEQQLREELTALGIDLANTDVDMEHGVKEQAVNNVKGMISRIKF